jgi:glycerol-3-phosphate O-acyltransferase
MSLIYILRLMEARLKSKKFNAKLQKLYAQQLISERYYSVINDFIESFCSLVEECHSSRKQEAEEFLREFLESFCQQCLDPFPFSSSHKKENSPIDFYQMGMKFVSYLADLKKSVFQGKEQVSLIEDLLKKQHNVVLFANHQVEADPQVIDYVLQDSGFDLGKEMFFVAGMRVLDDPIAAPFSRGRNLLCIHSKKYIETPPERKREKQQHNHKTMRVMKELLSEGGKCIYVAPSGGRDRRDESGVVQVSSFDPQSLEMFYLMGRSASNPTHFFPLALNTYEILPPPSGIQTDLGEDRVMAFKAVGAFFGDELKLEELALTGNKQEIRLQRAKIIHQTVCNLYTQLKV